jgi:hypothetical protein
MPIEATCAYLFNLILRLLDGGENPVPRAASFSCQFYGRRCCCVNWRRLQRQPLSEAKSPRNVTFWRLGRAGATSHKCELRQPAGPALRTLGNRGRQLLPEWLRSSGAWLRLQSRFAVSRAKRCAEYRLRRVMVNRPHISMALGEELTQAIFQNHLGG